MGHRAYVAYEQENGTFSLHYSHWGAHDFALCERISETNPLGGPNDLEPKFLDAFTNMLDGMADENDMELAGRAVEKQNEKCVEPDPIQQFIQFEEVTNIIGDASGIETLYVVEQDFTVHGFRVELLHINGEQFGNILLRPREKHGDTDEQYSADFERGFISATRKQLTRLVKQGVLTVEEAKTEAIEAIVEWSANASHRLLPHSTAIPNDVLEDNPRSFLRTTSAHRYFGEMIPVSYGEINNWAIPDEISIPPAFSRIKDEIATEVTSEAETTTDEQLALTDLGEDDEPRILPDPTDKENTSLPDVNVDPDKYEFTSDNVAFTVNGSGFSDIELPMSLRDKLQQYKKFNRAIHPGLTDIYECQACRERDDRYEYGYLTDSDNIDSYKNRYTCSRSWKEFSTPHTLHVGGDHAPEAWVVSTSFAEGDDRRVFEDGNELAVLADDDGVPTYTVTISEMEAFRGEEGVIESTTVDVSPPEDAELPDSGVVESFPSTTVTGETNGKTWELTARFGTSTLQIEWERLTEDGDVIEYKYRKPEERMGDKEFIGVTPVEVDDDENVVVERIAATASSHVMNGECDSTDFTKVWPPDDLRDRNVSVPGVESDEVPNAPQHLSRIQSGLKTPVSKGEIEELIARAAFQLRETYNVYDEFTGVNSRYEDETVTDETESTGSSEETIDA